MSEIASKIPKHVVLSRDLRRRIESGELKPGDRLPSFTEMRARYGVSQDTWERTHKLLEQDGLCVRERRRGIFVAEPRKARVKTIGFLSTSGQQPARYPYWAHILEGVRAAAAEAGTELLLIDSASEVIRWEHIDGVIAVGNHLQNFSKSVPVTMPRASLIQKIERVPGVVADECQGIRDTIAYLFALGHRRIAYLAMGTPARVAAYRAALIEKGIKDDARWVRGMEHDSGCERGKAVSFVRLGRSNMRDWLDEGFRDLGCTALLCQNDETALGAMEVLRDAGLRVPDDLSVIGFDGTEVAEYCSPALTTVEVPLNEIGALGLRTLLKLCQGEKVPPLTTLPTQLRVRETTGRNLHAHP